MGERIEILGVPINNVSHEQAIRIIEESVDLDEKKIIVTPNSEMLLYASKNNKFKDIIANAGLVVPDGSGVILAAKILGKELKERVAGVDLVQSLLRLGNERGYRFYILGGTPEVAKKVESKINKEFPGIFLKVHHGYFDRNTEHMIVEELKNDKFDVLFVGMGTPRQESWLFENLPHLRVSVGMGVGGSFDVLAGEKKRAPVIMQRLYLEWLFRLCQEPKRIIRVSALPVFLGKVLIERLFK